MRNDANLVTNQVAELPPDVASFHLQFVDSGLWVRDVEETEVHASDTQVRRHVNLGNGNHTAVHYAQPHFLKNKRQCFLNHAGNFLLPYTVFHSNPIKLSKTT